MECVMMMCVVMVVWTWFGTWFGGVVLQFLDVFCQKVGQKLSNRQVPPGHQDT